METKAVLNNWRTLNDALGNATEDECNALLKAEKAGEARPTFLHRIYGRMSVLRADRERRELTGAK